MQSVISKASYKKVTFESNNKVKKELNKYIESIQQNGRPKSGNTNNNIKYEWIKYYNQQAEIV